VGELAALDCSGQPIIRCCVSLLIASLSAIVADEQREIQVYLHFEFQKSLYSNDPFRKLHWVGSG
jgi:hypothetical protein